jgi:maltodextrin utilization protein YvdJ
LVTIWYTLGVGKRKTKGGGQTRRRKMKFEKKDWKVTKRSEGEIVVTCTNPVIDQETGEDCTNWPSIAWFRKNFAVAKDIKNNAEILPIDDGNSQNPEVLIVNR